MLSMPNYYKKRFGLYAFNPVCGTIGPFFLFAWQQTSPQLSLKTRKLHVPYSIFTRCKSTGLYPVPKIEDEVQGGRFVTVDLIQEAAPEKFVDITETDFSEGMKTQEESRQKFYATYSAIILNKKCARNDFLNFFSNLYDLKPYGTNCALLYLPVHHCITNRRRTAVPWNPPPPPMLARAHTINRVHCRTRYFWTSASRGLEGKERSGLENDCYMTTRQTSARART